MSKVRTKKLKIGSIVYVREYPIHKDMTCPACGGKKTMQTAKIGQWQCLNCWGRGTVAAPRESAVVRGRVEQISVSTNRPTRVSLTLPAKIDGDWYAAGTHLGNNKMWGCFDVSMLCVDKNNPNEPCQFVTDTEGLIPDGTTGFVVFWKNCKDKVTCPLCDGAKKWVGEDGKSYRCHCSKGLVRSINLKIEECQLFNCQLEITPEGKTQMVEAVPLRKGLRKEYCRDTFFLNKEDAEKFVEELSASCPDGITEYHLIKKQAERHATA